MILLGCLLLGVAFRVFTNPNRIVTGGITGVSTVFQGAFGWEPTVVQLAINVPVLICGFWMLGRDEGLRSLVGSFMLPICVGLASAVPPLQVDPILASLFGGAIVGSGLALVLSARGSVGGYSLIARILGKKLGWSVPGTILALDSATILAGAYQFGAERALLGILGAYIGRVSIDRALVGFGRSFMVMVISHHHEDIRKSVLTDLDRGLTVLEGTGGYSDQSRPVLMVAVHAGELPRLRALVAEIDSEAFVIVTSAAEVQGRGFRRE